MFAIESVLQWTDQGSHLQYGSMHVTKSSCSKMFWVLIKKYAECTLIRHIYISIYTMQFICMMDQNRKEQYCRHASRTGVLHGCLVLNNLSQWIRFTQHIYIKRYRVYMFVDGQCCPSHADTKQQNSQKRGLILKKTVMQVIISQKHAHASLQYTYTRVKSGIQSHGLLSRSQGLSL